MNFNIRSLFLLKIIVVLILVFGCQEVHEPKVLVFTKTAGYRHESIEAGIAAIKKLGAENSFVVDATEESKIFTEKNLSHYSAVIFLNTSGDVLDSVQQLSFEQYIRSGGGFAGIHAATDTEPTDTGREFSLPDSAADTFASDVRDEGGPMPVYK